MGLQRAQANALLYRSDLPKTDVTLHPSTETGPLQEFSTQNAAQLHQHVESLPPSESDICGSYSRKVLAQGRCSPLLTPLHSLLAFLGGRAYSALPCAGAPPPQRPPSYNMPRRPCADIRVWCPFERVSSTQIPPVPSNPCRCRPCACPRTHANLRTLRYVPAWRLPSVSPRAAKPFQPPPPWISRQTLSPQIWNAPSPSGTSKNWGALSSTSGSNQATVSCRSEFQQTKRRLCPLTTDYCSSGPSPLPCAGAEPPQRPPQKISRRECEGIRPWRPAAAGNSHHPAYWVHPSVCQRRLGNSQLGPNLTAMTIESPQQKRMAGPPRLHPLRHVNGRRLHSDDKPRTSAAQVTKFGQISITDSELQISAGGFKKRGTEKLFLAAPLEAR